MNAPASCVWEVVIDSPGHGPRVLGHYAPRIDYPGGLEAFAAVVWDSVAGATGPEDVRWARRARS